MQVWLGNRLVGEAKVSPRPGSNHIRISVLNELAPLSARGFDATTAFEPVVREIILKIDYRCFKISELDERRHGIDCIAEALRVNGVRLEDCSVSQDHMKMDKIYRFQVLRVTANELEEIFDFDWFEPADGPPDTDYMERQREFMMGNFAV